MYKVIVNNPKSDSEKKIIGKIDFKSESSNNIKVGYTIGTLSNLPNPFINILSGSVISISSIGPLQSNKVTNPNEEDMVQSMLQLLRSDFLMKFGYSIDLTVSRDTTESSMVSNTSLAANNIVNTPDNKKITEFIFNVESENVFKNFEMGDLTIINKETDTYIFDDSQDTIDPEFIEGDFEGSEENTFISPVEDIQEFESELDSIVNSNSYNDSNTPAVPGTKSGNMKLIANAAKSIGITSKYAIASMIAISAGESGLKPQEEGHVYSYSNLSGVFRGLNGSQKERASTRGISKREFFNIVYGEYNPGRVGNRSVSDGGLYYGRGFIQLTGYQNYVRYNNLLKKYFPSDNSDIIKNPGLVNDATVCSKLVALYFLDRVKTSQHSSSYLESALRAVGNDANGGYDKKRKFYNKIIGDNSLYA